MLKLRPGLRLALILALSLFALFIGIGSALVEIATITRVQVEAAVARAELAANLVISQLAISIRSDPGRSPADIVRGDSRLASVMIDAQQFTPAVEYLFVADTNQVILRHTDDESAGRSAPARPELAAEAGFGALRQFVSILKETGAYEVAVPFMVGNRDFGAVRVGLAPSLLRADLVQVLKTQVLKLALQVLLATAFGIIASWIVLLRPLGRIQAGIDHLQRGEFNYRVNIDSEDELGHIARQINTLSELLAQERQLMLHQHETLVSEGDTLRRLVDAVDDGLLMLDSERRVLMANRTAVRILGSDMKSVAGQPLAALLPPEHSLLKMVEKAFSGPGRGESTPVEFRTEDGPHVYLASGQVIGDVAQPQGAMIAMRDLARMRRLQEMIDHARVLSRLGKMAAGVAHEIRNPLNAMNIHLELLKGKMTGASRGLPSAGQDHLDIVMREIARLERVVHGFLRLARLQELRLERIQVAPFLEELRQLVLPEARMAGLDIRVTVDPAVSEFYGDEEVLRQALLNLLRNAIQASPAGASPITVSVSPRDQQLRLVIEDHGLGMSEETKAKAFDLYFTTKKEGSGVGLALVQQAVELHGGRVDLESEPGRGARFTITLPTVAAA